MKNPVVLYFLVSYVLFSPDMETLVMFYVAYYFWLIDSFRFSNFRRSCIKRLFVLYVVFTLSGMHIYPPYRLLLFPIAYFDKCFFLDRFPCFFQVMMTNYA